ncbi:MAG: hypothetical protein JST68_25735 [Bacteroidetes bacterium]|nr:hypothetical protein [Bacteroidota bacterium]
MSPIPKLSLLFLSVIVSFSLSAQRNLQTGYVVLRSSDTLRGQIDYREWGINPGHIVFQPDKGGEPITYGPEELGAFFVAGDLYEGHQVTIYPYSENPVVAASEDFSTKPYQRTIFLRQLESGKMRLYEYKDSTATIYYFVGKGSEQPWQLRMISRKVGADGHYGVVYDPYYRIQLGEPTGDCPGAAPLLKRAEYKRSSLSRIVFQYNHCGQDTIEKISVRERGRLSFYPTLGYLDSKLNYSGGTPLTFGSYRGVIGGASLLYVMPRNRGQWGFVADLLFHHLKSTSTFGSVNQYINTQAVMDCNLLKLDLLFRYSPPLEGKVRPFIQAGMSNSLIVSNKSYQDEYNSVNVTITRKPFMDFRNYHPGFAFGAGATAGRFNLEIRYDRRQFSDLINLSAATRNFYFLVGFSL